METYQLYIGSNNETKQLEISRIEAILNLYHEGFTIQEAIGYWLGMKERTAIVTITDDKIQIEKSIAHLKEELRQDAIAWQQVPLMHFA